MKVSVVIPVYNVEPYIARCIESVINQSYTDIEVVVVDDATPDRSMDVVQKYQRLDARIRTMHHTVNRGLMVTRRDGFEMATGNYIVVLDSDDCLAPQAIEKLVTKAEQGQPDIVAGQLLKVNADGSTQLIASEPLDSSDKETIYKALLEERLKHSLAGKMYKADLLKDKSLRTFEQVTVSEDGCLFYQLAALCNRIVTLDEVVYYYMENKSSSTHVTYTEKQMESMVIANRVMADCLALYPSLKAVAYHRFTFNVCRLYMERVPWSRIRDIVKRHRMSAYAFSLGNMLRLTFADYWFFLKRFVYVRIR